MKSSTTLAALLAAADALIVLAALMILSDSIFVAAGIGDF
jgi:hypothetical protein